MSQKKRILVSCSHMQRTIDECRPWFEEHDLEFEMPPMEQQLLESELLPIIDRFDGVIAGDDEFTRAVLTAGKKLKCVAKWGIGMDGIDRVAAKELGIKVMNTPAAFGDEVADVAMGYIIMLSRGLHLMDRAVRQGRWRKPEGLSLKGKSLGIIGLGSIGASLAERASAFGMTVTGSDVRVCEQKFAEQLELQDVLARSDFVVLTCNLTKNNHHLLNPKTFAHCKKGAYIVNVARGPLIDEKALVSSLNSGALRGAALDVFEKEPLAQSSPLLSFEQVIFGCHNASNTGEAVRRVNRMAFENLLSAL